MVLLPAQIEGVVSRSLLELECALGLSLREVGRSADGDRVEGTGWMYDRMYMGEWPAPFVSLVPVTVTGELRSFELSLRLVTPDGLARDIRATATRGPDPGFAGMFCGGRLVLERVERIATGSYDMTVDGALDRHQHGATEYEASPHGFQLRMDGQADLGLNLCLLRERPPPGTYQLGENHVCGASGSISLPDTPYLFFIRSGTLRITESRKRAVVGELTAVATDLAGTRSLRVSASFSATCYLLC
ncbi:MAG TPA: hypothetical protein VF862_06270 [Gemmatimonadales bacterium]